jgi:hypothetical protein
MRSLTHLDLTHLDLTHLDKSRQISGVIYLKLAELPFISLLLVFIYPFFFACPQVTEPS